MPDINPGDIFKFGPEHSSFKAGSTAIVEDRALWKTSSWPLLTLISGECVHNNGPAKTPGAWCSRGQLLKRASKIRSAEDQTTQIKADETDNPVEPMHYRQGSIECIDAIEAATADKPPQESYLVGNVIRYVWRYKAKGGLEDLRKARWYIERLIRKYLGP